MHWRHVLIVSIHILNSNFECLAQNEVSVDIPTDLLPKKETLFWQRQLLILFVPTNNFGIGPGVPIGGVVPGGVPIPGQLPIGQPGLGQPGLGQPGFNARLNRLNNIERLRTLRRRTRIRVRSTTANYENIDTEN
ncbi:unnamed protein product [Medioppia subpectinata]|uniref:Uncharacterized protein n=1 Tax=Medioppia subpectinata TaxID=1979941 RepID=A0A7R9Q4D5_9ACAR|nr:unnamed protein product [Medioppia subpectinata]CAG2111514.1 unnamed protein product [Medioppia subpectinata]